MARPVEITRWVPDDNAGIRMIVAESMIPRIRESIHLPSVYLFTNPFERAQPEQTISALLYWVRGHMIYTPDPPNEELIKWPSVLLDEIRRHGQALGDCDDYVMLFATFALSRGFAVRLVTIARKEVDDGAGQMQLDHIYTRVLIDGEWIAVDPTGDVALGWEHGQHYPVYREEVVDV
jgi:transglutaminase-like putative cysteine protease